MPKRMETLLTGFGPFAKVINNPTERLTAHFASEPVAGHCLTLCPLPTSFERAPQRLRAALEAGGRGGRPFDNIVMLGLASGSPCWRVERFGRNRDESQTDADGFTPPERAILPDGPEILPVTFPAETLVAALERLGLPARASDSAGGYLCNHILYRTLWHLHSAGSATRAVFLHVPADEQTFAPDATPAPLFPFAQHVEAVRAVLDALAQPPSNAAILSSSLPGESRDF